MLILGTKLWFEGPSLSFEGVHTPANALVLTQRHRSDYSLLACLTVKG